jgi:hypothetical protein
MASLRAVRRGRRSTSALGRAAVFSGERPRWEGRRPASDGDGLRRAAVGGVWPAVVGGRRRPAMVGGRQRPAMVGGRRPAAGGASACDGRRGLWRAAFGLRWSAVGGLRWSAGGDSLWWSAGGVLRRTVACCDRRPVAIGGRQPAAGG